MMQQITQYLSSSFEPLLKERPLFKEYTETVPLFDQKDEVYLVSLKRN